MKEGGIELDLHRLLKEFGELYSKELGIDVEKDAFKWFLASVLFGARISTTIAKSTYRAYEEAGLTTPERIAKTDWSTLVRVHGRGGYVRYDGITAEYIKGIADKLLRDYGGDIRRLDQLSESPEELERRLLEFRGVGRVTVKIFLRELRGIWKNADPEPSRVEIVAARELGIVDSEENALERMKAFWNKNKVKGYDLRNLEATLVRIGLALRRGKRLEAIIGK